MCTACERHVLQAALAEADAELRDLARQLAKALREIGRLRQRMVPALLARAEAAEAGRAAAEQAAAEAAEMLTISRAERRDLEERLRRTETLLNISAGSGRAV